MLEIDGRKIWEQASGDGDRSYPSVCLKWGVILNGTGKFGEWNTQNEVKYRDNLTSKKCTGLRRFCEEMQDGDVVILKSGKKSAIAVGLIVGGYIWREDFGDIDGWELQHVRRVNWIYTERKTFEKNTFKWGDTSQKLISDSALEWLMSLSLSFDSTYELPTLPEINNFETNLEKVSDYLFDIGMANESVNKLSANIEGILRIARWYSRMEKDDQKRVSEHETIAYLVVPFLSHLGWTPQKMAIEWKRIDVALFYSMPRNATTLTTVVEVKKLGDSCLKAQSQAEKYAIEHGCERLVVTNGIRYGVFHKQKTGFELTSYLNITRLRSSYPVYECQGAEHSIHSLLPEMGGS